jgi:hypothetical protein
MTKILGIDIGAKFVVAFCLSGIPEGISHPDFYKKNAKACLFTIRLDNSPTKPGTNLSEAIALLESIGPSAIVMEPTGVWYSRLWADIAEHLNIPVKWIGHSDLAHHRGAYGFRDKDDRTDAFCLAAVYFDPIFNADDKWLRWRVGAVGEVNDLLLKIKSLETTTKILQMQMRQRLKHEFPEVAGRTISTDRTSDGFTPWVGYLAGIHTYKRIENERAKSIATTLGIEIADYTQNHALSICRNQIREGALKANLTQALLYPEFDQYRETLELFGFGVIMQATILSQIYPIEKFLMDGKPYIDRYEDDRGKHKKNRSLAGFQLSLGMGKRLIESGGKSKLMFAGSSFARKMLYTWTSQNVLPERMSKSWLVKELDRRADSGSEKSMTVAQLRTRWKTTKGTPKDRHMAGVRATITLNYRITRLLFEKLFLEVSG